jgi:DNA-binding protein Fis
MSIQINLQDLIHTHAAALPHSTGHAYQALKNQIEPQFFYQLLKYTHGNKTQAANIAGIDIGTLARKLKQYCIEVNKQIVSRLSGSEV